MHTVLLTAGTFVGYTIILVGLFAGKYEKFVIVLQFAAMVL